MNISLKLAIGSIFAATILINFSSAATADQIRKVGIVAIVYDANNNISSLASSIAIGKMSLRVPPVLWGMRLLLLPSVVRGH